MKEKFLQAMQDKDFSELFKKGGISFLMRIGGQIMGFVITFIIAYYFGAKGLGDYVLAIIVLRVFTLIAKLGIDTASIRFIASYATKGQWSLVKEYRKKITILLTFSTLFCSCLMYCFSQEIAEIIGANPEYIRLNAFFVLPMAFFMLNYQSLRGMKKIAEYSFFYWMSRTFFSAIIILIAVQFSKNINIPIYAFLLGLVFSSILSYLVFRKKLNYKLQVHKLVKTVDRIKELVSMKAIILVSLPLMLAQSGQFVIAWTDKLMLGGMATSYDVGVYDVAFKLSMFVNIALSSVTSISAPKFAEMYEKKDFVRLENIVNQATKLIFWTSLPLLLLFFFFSVDILRLFGSDFESGLTVFYFLCFARGVSAFTGPAGNLLQMTGRHIIFMNVLFAGAIINIVLNYLLIPLYGIEGAAISSMSSIIFWNLAMVYFVKKEFGFFTIYIPFIKR